MIKFKKKSRLNDENRKLIVDAVINSKMSDDIKLADELHDSIGGFIQNMLLKPMFDEITNEQRDIANTKGLLPTVDRLIASDFNELQNFYHTIKLTQPVAIPFAYYESYGRGDISYAGRNVIQNSNMYQDFVKVVNKYIEIRHAKESMYEKLFDHLRGFTSPGKLVDSHPEFIDYIPLDLIESKMEQAEGIDDILASA